MLTENVRAALRCSLLGSRAHPFEIISERDLDKMRTAIGRQRLRVNIKCRPLVRRQLGVVDSMPFRVSDSSFALVCTSAQCTSARTDGTGEIFGYIVSKCSPGVDSARLRSGRSTRNDFASSAQHFPLKSYNVVQLKLGTREIARALHTLQLFDLPAIRKLDLYTLSGGRRGRYTKPFGTQYPQKYAVVSRCSTTRHTAPSCFQLSPAHCNAPTRQRRPLLNHNYCYVYRSSASDRPARGNRARVSSPKLFARALACAQTRAVRARV